MQKEKKEPKTAPLQQPFGKRTQKNCEPLKNGQTDLERKPHRMGQGSQARSVRKNSGPGEEIKNEGVGGEPLLIGDDDTPK